MRNLERRSGVEDAERVEGCFDLVVQRHRVGPDLARQPGFLQPPDAVFAELKSDIEALRALEKDAEAANFTGAYIPMAERTAQMLHSIEVERVLAEMSMRLR